MILFFLSVTLLFCCGSQKRESAVNIRYEIGAGAGRYIYAPSVIEDENEIRYAFVCQNRDSFKVVDYVYLYKGIPSAEGYVWQPATIVLEPSTEGWDSCHICDPDVRQFRTTYKGKQYNWIMTYLGVDQWDNNHNQIGLAIAENIEGPYLRFDRNPLISYHDTSTWGVGQSTSVVLDPNTIRLFYTKYETGFLYRDIKLSNLDNIEIGEEVVIPGMPWNNYVAYSPDYIYAAGERRSADYDNQIPNWVGDICELKRIPRTQTLSSHDSLWTMVGKISPIESGFARNHNPGILTDVKGYLPDDDEVIMYFTSATTGDNWLWSYDLYSAQYKINK